MEEPLASGLPPKRFAVQVGLALSLFLAFCDLVVSTNTQLIEIHSAVALLGPLVGMFAAVLAAYSAGLLFIAVPLGRLTSLKTQGLTLAVGVSAAAPFLFSIVWSQALTEGTAFPRPHILGLGLTCWVFVATYLAWEGLAKFRGAPSFVLRIGFSMPFVLAETFAFQWLIREAVGLQRSWGFFLLLALYLVVCAVTIRYMTRPRRELRVFGGLLSLSAALCLSLAVSFTVENYSKGSLPPVSERAHRIRRVILLTVDTLRRDALSCCGGTTPTPHIDRLAKDAILFERAHSASPWTLPSLTTILSGLSPWVHGVRRIDHQVPVGLPSLALFFRKDDYVTAGIGSNYFLHTRGSYASLSVGFDSYDTYPVYHRPLTLGRDIVLRFSPTAFGDTASTDDLTRLAQEWVTSHQHQDFFLWLHYLDPHLPYEPPPNFFPQGEPDPTIGRRYGDKALLQAREGSLILSPTAIEWVRALYRGEVRYVDDRVGRFLSTLKDLGIYEDSLIVFTSDHGEEHYEHRGIDHGHTLYEELLRVPLIVKLPGSTVKAEIEQTVSLESVLPTILDLSNIEFDREAFSGRSLQTLWTNGASSNSEVPVFSTGLMSYDERESVVFEGLKYIRSRDWPREELYDLESDPGEKNNIVFLHADKVAEARKLLAAKAAKGAKLRKLYGLGPTELRPLDAEAIERLRSLGYAQ